MREVAFIRRHREQWEQFEVLLADQQSAGADQLASAYVQLMDDLAYARAQYPQAATTQYLNDLAARVHASVSRNRRLRTQRVRKFFFHDVPTALLEIRPHLALAFTAFVLGITLGFVAGLQNDDLARSILGNTYVDMTKSNIENGHPLEVYATYDGQSMFLAIAFNNLMILLRSVGMGLIPVLGAAYLIVNNSVMLGCFMGLFTRYNEFESFSLGVWIHGTLEISAFVVASAAAIKVTEAVLLPGTYPRLEAFARGVRTAVLVALGMVPLVVLAALLESFVTRFNEVSPILDLGIIAASLGVVVWYVIILPQTLVKRQRND
jgi:uncharacterized membrane protein SpoIIM required for sporulation